jgi:hypothetical protein
MSARLLMVLSASILLTLGTVLNDAGRCLHTFSLTDIRSRCQTLSSHPSSPGWLVEAVSLTSNPGIARSDSGTWLQVSQERLRRLLCSGCPPFVPVVKSATGSGNAVTVANGTGSLYFASSMTSIALISA